MFIRLSQVFDSVSCGYTAMTFSKMDLDLEHIVINLFNSLQVCSVGTVSPTTTYVTPVTTSRPPSGPACQVTITMNICIKMCEKGHPSKYWRQLHVMLFTFNVYHYSLPQSSRWFAHKALKYAQCTSLKYHLRTTLLLYAPHKRRAGGWQAGASTEITAL